MKQAYWTFFVILMACSAGYGDVCSWAGSVSSCRKHQVGAACAVDGKVGICAISASDRCKCVTGRITVRPTGEVCSWAGSDSSCRKQQAGSVCARGNKAGVCAFRFSDRCKCARAGANVKVKKAKKRKRVSNDEIAVGGNGFSIQVGDGDEDFSIQFGNSSKKKKKKKKKRKARKSDKKCSWVGSDSACREAHVGTHCAKDGKAGICALKQWDQCACVRAE